VTLFLFSSPIWRYRCCYVLLIIPVFSDVGIIQIAVHHIPQRQWLVGGLEHYFYDFPYIGNNHPNWRTHIFQRGRYTTNQIVTDLFLEIKVCLWVSNSDTFSVADNPSTCWFANLPKVGNNPDRSDLVTFIRHKKVWFLFFSRDYSISMYFIKIYPRDRPELSKYTHLGVIHVSLFISHLPGP